MWDPLLAGFLARWCCYCEKPVLYEIKRVNGGITQLRTSEHAFRHQKIVCTPLRSWGLLYKLFLSLFCDVLNVFDCHNVPDFKR
mmetsp:Transcript_28528/g.66282  ORF Transcript_28528/g.66282 Transcript_28528/m.66282 type:complete len:84 (+) Transcript_28528:480-731(+)